MKALEEYSGMVELEFYKLSNHTPQSWKLGNFS
jgi:hypothetical protein